MLVAVSARLVVDALGVEDVALLIDLPKEDAAVQRARVKGFKSHMVLVNRLEDKVAGKEVEQQVGQWAPPEDVTPCRQGDVHHFLLDGFYCFHGCVFLVLGLWLVIDGDGFTLAAIAF